MVSRDYDLKLWIIVSLAAWVVKLCELWRERTGRGGQVFGVEGFGGAGEKILGWDVVEDQ